MTTFTFGAFVEFHGKFTIEATSLEEALRKLHQDGLPDHVLMLDYQNNPVLELTDLHYTGGCELDTDGIARYNAVDRVEVTELLEELVGTRPFTIPS